MKIAQTSKYPICVKCGKPVEKSKDEYDAYEKMHWLCFHLEFEHDNDPDLPCNDPSCPQWHLEVYRKRLIELGVDPDTVISEAIDEKRQL